MTSHLSKLLVDDSEFEGVVHLVFVVSHHQLGSLCVHKKHNVLLTYFVTHFLLAVVVPPCLRGRFIGLRVATNCHGPQRRRQTRRLPLAD